MRNFTIYLVLFLCLFVSKINAQDPSQKVKQAEQTFKKEYEKMNIQIRQNRQDEEKIYEEEVRELKIRLKNRIISQEEFNEQKIILENKKESNILAKNDLLRENIRKQFPWMGAITFEERAEIISNGIRNDVHEEKQLLKQEIEAVDKELIEGTITKTQAEEQKIKLAETRAKHIESKVAERQKSLSKLVQEEIEGKLPEQARRKTRLTMGGNNSSKSNIGENYDFVFPTMKTYDGQEDKDRQQNKRTSSQLVFAIGANNLVTDGSVSNSGFKYAQSRFYEWGFTFNSRIIPNHNLLHAKYGLSFMYNDLRPTNNRYFVDYGSQTVLETSSKELKDSRFRNVNVVVPLHLEFDFTKPKVENGKTYFKSHNSFRLGIGGYLGTNIKSKQILKYNIDGYKSSEVIKSNFNTNDFIYGLSTYVGYKATSLYLKYDLNPLFKDNTVKQNNVSLGLRFDFN